MRDPNMARLDFISSIALTAFGLFVFVESWRMPRFTDQGGVIYSAPGLVPGVLAVVLILCGLIVLIRSVAQGGWRLSDGGAMSFSPGARNVLVTVAISIIYVVLLIGTIPFWLATTIYAFVYTAIFELRGAPPEKRVPMLLSNLVLALAVAWGVTLVFERIFLVRMP
jgi:hypothetical protein